MKYLWKVLTLNFLKEDYKRSKSGDIVRQTLKISH